MKLGSLCTGYGGLDLAVEATFGAHTVWTAENDSSASKIISHRFPNAPNLGDFTTTDWEGVDSVDIISAGWPCQPFSVAGKRKGAADARALWPEVARAVRALRPRYVVLENVSAIATAGTGPELARATASLAALGYVGSWLCLRASDVGAPHRRERIFILAATNTRHRDRQRREGTGLGPSLPSRVRRGRPRDRDSATPLLPTPTVSDHRNEGERPEVLQARGYGINLASATRWILPTPSAADGLGGHERFGQYADAIARWEPIVGRPAPAPTVNGRLSPRFVEWMMGLPDGWVCDVPGVTRAEQLRALGNGVVPQQAYAAITQMITTSEGNRHE